jgi:glycerol kinase
VVGITKGIGRAHFARAAIEAIAYQCRDVIDKMSDAAGGRPRHLCADGGAAVMDLLMEIQADQCDIPIVRPRTTEVTATGAAMLAGLNEGVWASLDELQSLKGNTEVFDPTPRRQRADADHAEWLRALERSRGWERPNT